MDVDARRLDRTTTRLLPLGAALLALQLATGCGLGVGSDAPEATVTTTVTASPGAAETPGAAAGATAAAAALDERRFFSADSPWNVRVDTVGIDERSSEMIALAKERIGVIEQEGDLPPRTQRRVVDEGIYINTEAWTTPVVAGGVPTDLVCRQLTCGDEIEGDSLAVPSDIDPDARYDGWFTIVDLDSDTAYDLWRARREDDGTISYHFARRWNLDGTGYGEPQLVGARGSGLPLFAGLIRPGELEAGRIEHALALSVPGPAQRTFVSPASSTDGNGRGASLPEGARVRLRSDVVLRPAIDPLTGEEIELTIQQRRLADAIVATLRTYGAIIVDRAAVPTLYAQRDATAGLLAGNELQGLTLDDFEVLELGTRYKYPPDAEPEPGTASGTEAHEQDGEETQ
ncbi:hypothetical protein [Nocardioides pacificus]